VTPAQRRADALGLLAECALRADFDRGTTSDRYQVVLHVDAAALQSAGEPPSDPAAGQAVVELNDGAMNVSAETSRRLACDASLVVIGHSADGSVLDVGRKTRTIPFAIRRTLPALDRGCQFPAAPHAAATGITFATGPMVDRRPCTISSCCDSLDHTFISSRSPPGSRGWNAPHPRRAKAGHHARSG
jgi:hypothetical protein